jgi:hypothetical protein
VQKTAMVKVDFLTNLRGMEHVVPDNDVHSVELCINSSNNSSNDSSNNSSNDSSSPAQSSSLESSMSAYDSMLQSLHDELNHSPPELDMEDDIEFFNMDCATAISFDYEMNYTIKQLKHIAGYYGLKCKHRKVDLIQDIVLFETDDKNGDAVSRRKRLFYYMDTLKHDEYLKSYVIM